MTISAAVDVAPDATRRLRTLVALSLGALAIRFFASRHVGFGDSEALYACYALHPQPAYLDHPGLVGLLARVLGQGTAPSPLVAHGFTTILATLAPWIVVMAARATGASWRAAASVAIGVALVPEIAVGLFAMTPDLLLFVAWVFALGFAAVGLRAPPSSNRAAGAWVIAGLLSGIGCAAKVSAVTLMAALVATILSRAARPHARTVWPWLGLLAGLVVVLPIGSYEARTGWPMLVHRLVDTQAHAGLSLRNAGALLLGQAVYVSPVVAVAAAFVARDLWRTRRADSTSVLLANATFLPLVVLVPLCLWSRVAEPHWLAPALLALPLHLARRAGQAVILSPRLARASVVTAGVITVLAHTWALVPALVAFAPASYDSRLDLANELYGWPEVILAVRRLAAEEQASGGDPIAVVGPHWIVCAQLEAALRTDLPVGCAGPERDDFDGWLPRKNWEAVDTIVFVSDNRFEIDFHQMFPDRTLTRQTRLAIVRGGRMARVFTLAVLERRGAA